MILLHETPIPTLLVMAGIALISIAVLGKKAMELSPRRQLAAAAVGVSFLVIGLLPYLLPAIPSNLLIQADGAIIAHVDARREWQPAGIDVAAGARVEMTVAGGEWTYWRGHAMYSMGEGTGYICGETRNPNACVEILPMYPPDTLIGRIGDQMFPIGQGTTITAEQSGRLELRINDGSSGLYDNDGILAVRVMVREG